MEKKTAYFYQLYNATYDKVLAYVLRKCGKIDEAEDILQEVYSELLKVLLQNETNYIKSPEAFVQQLAKSKVYRYYSEKERQKVCAYVENLENIEYLERLNTNWEDVLLDKLTAQEVMTYIAGKDELTREIFYQHYFEGKTLKEIAESCGVKESKVKDRLYRTLREIRGSFVWRVLSITGFVLLACLLAKPAYTFAKNAFVQMKTFFFGEEQSPVNDLVHWEYDGPSIKLDAGEEIKVSTFGATYENVEICLLGSEATETIGMLNRTIEYSFTAPVAGTYFIFAMDEEGKPVNITEKVKIEHTVKGTSGTIYLD